MTDTTTPKSGLSRREALRLMAASGLAAFVAPQFLGGAAFAQGSEAPKGRVVVGMSQEPTVFNPLMVHAEVDDAVAFSVFDALFRIDARARSSPTSPPRCRPSRTAASPPTA